MSRRGRAVVVTGMSGAGRTTCLKTLEDLGYEAVDNLPVGLLERLLRADDAPGEGSDLAVGVDTRTRDFEPRRLLRQLRGLRDRSSAGPAGAPAPGLLFLDCADEVLQRRFSASRRRHPLADDDLPVGEALAQERALLAPLREAADLVVDTTDLALPDLRRILAGHFGGGAGMGMAVVSFSYKRGVPRDADLVLDVRFLRNPHYVDALRPLTGLDPDVQAHVRGDPALEPFVAGVQALLGPLLPLYEAAGKSYLTLAFGCTGGQHRSVYVAERLAAWLRAEGGREAAVRHRDIPGGTPGEGR